MLQCFYDYAKEQLIMDYEQLQFERNKAIEDMIKELKNGVRRIK